MRKFRGDAPDYYPGHTRYTGCTVILRNGVQFKDEVVYIRCVDPATNSNLNYISVPVFMVNLIHPKTGVGNTLAGRYLGKCRVLDSSGKEIKLQKNI